MVKTDVKSVFWRVSFSRDLVCHLFLFLYLCHLPTTCCSWVLFLKEKVVHCVLSFWLVCVMLRSYVLMFFKYLWICSQIEPDATLCYHCMHTLELESKPKTAWAQTHLDFPLGLWTWVVKSIKQITLAEKNTKKVLKLTKLMTQISWWAHLWKK